MIGHFPQVQSGEDSEQILDYSDAELFHVSSGGSRLPSLQWKRFEKACKGEHGHTRLIFNQLVHYLDAHSQWSINSDYRA